MKTTRSSLLLCLCISLLCSVAVAQTRTIQSDGNWDNPSIWQGGNIADVIGEDVDFNNNVDVTIPAAASDYTVGNVAFGNNNTLTVASGRTLNVGSSGAGNARNFTAPNGGIITVEGNLVIWGNLEADNNLRLIVNGSVTIRGNIDLRNGAVLNISGTGLVQVDGNLTTQNNPTFIVDGTLRVNGTLTTGNGAARSGTGPIVVGSCVSSTAGFCSLVALPVTLLSFTAKATETGVLAEWTTALELNNSHFTLERSTDGKSFTAVGTVPGAGNSNLPRQYRYEDKSPQAGLSYYRLRQTDFDGHTEVFNIRAVRFSKKTGVFDLYPNPAVGGQVTIHVSAADGPLQAQLYDLHGRLLETASLAQGENPLTIRQPQGVYLVRLVNSGQLLGTRKVVVTR
ncbi:MAG: T9SS type A sorting domain-containing protein [Cytophagales bacterium]|nr:T9SS type A sorting domain-containing protein [Cytophagales bacterium]